MFDPHDAKFWVMIAFILFMALLVFYKVPRLVAKILDDRADAIRKELDEARRLREAAQQLLADYQRKAREADEEAKSIIQQAKREAEVMASETRKGLVDSLERRTKLAEDKIARAEAQAQAEVRGAAVEAALGAAEKILKMRVSGATAAGLIEDGIRDIKGRLN